MKFTLKSLMVLVVVVSFGALIIAKYNDIFAQERASIAAIQAKSGFLTGAIHMETKWQRTWRILSTASASRVDSVDLNNPQFNDTDIPLVLVHKRVRRISLSGSLVSGAGLQQLAALPELIALDLTQTPRITAADVAEFVRRRPDVYVTHYG